MSKSPLLVTKPSSLSLTRADGSRVSIRLRRHPHAKRIKLSFLPERGFLLTLPQQTPLATLQHALAEFDPWIEQVLARHSATPSVLLPTELHFNATQERWAFHYGALALENAHDRGAAVHIRHQRTTVAAQQQLLRWFKAAAEARLAPWLERLASQHGFDVRAVSVGLARARWGSCSASKRIRLNAALLLIDAELVEYVLIHELAHTRHLDHSAAFWRCVGAIDPDYPRKQQALRLARHALPLWLWQPPSSQA